MSTEAKQLVAALFKIVQDANSRGSVVSNVVVTIPLFEKLFTSPSGDPVTDGVRVEYRGIVYTAVTGTDLAFWAVTERTPLADLAALGFFASTLGASPPATPNLQKAPKAASGGCFGSAWQVPSHDNDFTDLDLGPLGLAGY